MLLFLLLILVIFVLWPLLVAGWKIFRQVRMMRRFMNDPMAEMRRQAQQQNRTRASRNSDSGNPFGFWFGGNDDAQETYKAPRGKKIPKDTGEYIPFTEINISEQELKAYFARTATYVRAEEQVTDIKWTDL